MKTLFTNYINKIKYPTNEINNIILLNKQYYEKITDNNIIISKQIGSTVLTQLQLTIIDLIMSTIDLYVTTVELIINIIEIYELPYLIFVRLSTIIKLLEIISDNIVSIIDDVDYIDFYYSNQ